MGRKKRDGVLVREGHDMKLRKAIQKWWPPISNRLSLVENEQGVKFGGIL